ELLVLFVGRIQKAKGAFDLLSAWTKVHAACPDAFLTVVGQDRSEGRFLQKAQSLRIDQSIRLTGPVEPSRIADVMRRSRLFCLPSYKEGTPNCIMEALSCGLPIITTRVGGIPDIVEHEKSGFLIDSGDVE